MRPQVLWWDAADGGPGNGGEALPTAGSQVMLEASNGFRGSEGPRLLIGRTPLR